VIYGWYGGLDRKYAAFLPNELLTWSILKWGAEIGFKHYDFGGAGRPDERYGVRDFKAKFAGKPVSFGRNVYVHSPMIYRLCRAAYRIRVGLRKNR
jgi:lipid II:glycine glycyltransferase (peptidoglycan interpeptide bridge formation enzyme)